jgi:hypothetical protein
VIRNAALARTIVVQHVTGPKPALLHALPRVAENSDHSGGIGHQSRCQRARRAKILEFRLKTARRRTLKCNKRPARAASIQAFW